MGKWKFSKKINKTKEENENLETINAHKSTHKKLYIQVTQK